MCNRYVSPAEADIERQWHIGARQPWRGGEVYPRAPGPFIRAPRKPGSGRDAPPAPATHPTPANAPAHDEPAELVVGQWGLVPWFAKTAKLPYATNNARFEELASKASYKHPWARGQRCIIPAYSFDEPNWESGKNIWWRFRRADAGLWGLAGLWNVWTDPASGELVESYTMLTLNADAHPLMSRMHKPDPKLPPDQQDKRSVVPIADGDVRTWLFGSHAEAAALVRLTEADVFDGAPVLA